MPPDLASSPGDSDGPPAYSLRMRRICFLELVLIAIPVLPFDLVSLALLLGSLPHAAPLFSLGLFLLWAGGCLGTYALWSMYLRIHKGKSAVTVHELPLLPLACGLAANGVPVFWFLFNADKPDRLVQVVFCLLFLAPSYVALHWAYLLLKSRSPLP